MRRPSLDRVPADTGAGVVIAVFGIGYTALALDVPADPSETSVIGPGVFPLLFGVLLTVGALALVASSLAKARAGRTTVHAAAEPAAGAPEPAAGPRRNFWVLMGLLAGYVVLFLPLGYLLSTVLFLAVLTSYLDRRRVTVNLLFSVLFPIAVYLLFGFGLGIILPAGVLSGVLP